MLVADIGLFVLVKSLFDYTGLLLFCLIWLDCGFDFVVFFAFTYSCV